MTIISCSLEARYHNWYDKAIDYAFDFFDDPLYGDDNQKDFLSMLLLDPKTWLILLAYLTYQLQRLFYLMTDNKSIALYTNVTEEQCSLHTNVFKEPFLLVASVNNATDSQIIHETPMQYFRSKENLKVFSPSYSGYIMGGWAFLRIFRKILLIHLVNYHKPWRKTMIPFFQKGFRYLLMGHKPSVNMPFSESSFC